MNDFEYLPPSVPIERITYDLCQPDDQPPYLVGYTGMGGGSFLIRSLDRIDEQIADLLNGRKLLGDALDRWFAAKATVLPVRQLPPDLAELVHDDRPAATAIEAGHPYVDDFGFTQAEPADPFAGDAPASQPGPVKACNDELEGIGGALFWCELEAGHGGEHREGNTTWSHLAATDEPAALDDKREHALDVFNAAHDAEDARVDADQAQAGAG